MKPIGAMVTIRMRDWDEDPSPGDYLRTTTGRLYLVDAVVGPTIAATVMAKDTPIEQGARVFDFYWVSRDKKQRRGRAPIC